MYITISVAQLQRTLVFPGFKLYSGLSPRNSNTQRRMRGDPPHPTLFPGLHSRSSTTQRLVG